jgi:hypothetical protein
MNEMKGINLHMASECALFKFHFYLASISILEV